MAIEKLIKYIIYGGLISLLFTPFVVTNSLFFPYITGKAYFFRIIVEIIFFLWVALAVLNKEYRPKPSIILYSLIAFLISIFISDYIGTNWTASFWSNYERMDGYITLLHLFGLFLVAGSVLKMERDWKIIFNISIFASLLLAFLALRQMFIEDAGSRIDSSLGNPIYLSSYMWFHIFLALFYLLRTNYRKILWWVYLFVAVFNTFILFQTETRGAILGLFGGLIVLAVLAFVTNKSSESIRKISIGGLICIVVIAVGFFFIRNTDFVQSNTALKRIANISINSGTGEARLINWEIAIQGFKERPIFGWGQSNYNLVFDKYYLPAMHGNEPWFDRTHNIILDWMIAGGIVGFLLYISILISLLYLIWHKTPDLSNIDKSVLTALLATYVFHNFFVFDHLVSYLLFFLILAYIDSKNSLPLKSMQADISNLGKYTLAALSVIAIPIFVYAANYSSLSANLDLAAAIKLVDREPGTNNIRYQYEGGLIKNIELFERALSRNAFGTPEIRQRLMLASDTALKINDPDAVEVKNQFVNFAIAELENQIAETPADSKYPYSLGTYYARLGDTENAEKWLLEAVRLSPNKQVIRIPLIRTYLQSGQKEKALALAEETYYFDKSKDDIWIEYAKTVAVTKPDLYKQIVNEAAAEGDTEKVITLLKYNIEKQPDNVQNMISLSAFYYQIGNSTSSIEILDSAILKFPNYKYQLEQIKKDVNSRAI